MKLGTLALIGVTLLAVPLDAAYADLPTCGSVMQFGVDCRIGNPVSGGIVISGFSQLFSAPAFGVTYQPGGTIGFDLVQTSASTSRLRLMFDAAGAGAVHVQSVGGTREGWEQLQFSLSALEGGSLTGATLGAGIGATTRGCGGGGQCSWAAAWVNQSVNGQPVVGTTPVALDANRVDIQRLATARASAISLYQGEQPYSCGTSFRPRTCYQPVYTTLNASAFTPDTWTYEFDLRGTGLTLPSDPVAPVPEPNSLALLLIALATLWTVQRRRASVAG